MADKLVSWKGTLADINGDARRHGVAWKFHRGFWVGLSYRLRRLQKYGPFWRFVLLPIDLVLGLLRCALADFAIPSSVSIGPGLLLPHPTGIVINHKAKLGRDMALCQQVTLGEWHGSAPTIGDHTSLYSGARIIGGIFVGCNCLVGRDVVLNNNVCENTSVFVSPRIFRKRSKMAAM